MVHFEELYFTSRNSGQLGIFLGSFQESKSSRNFLEIHPTQSIKFGHVESYGSPNSISAGGDQSFCGYDSRIELAELDCDALSIPIFKMITFYQSRIGDACYQLKSSHSLTSDIKDNLEEIFSSSSCLNSSFLADDHYKTNS